MLASRGGRCAAPGLAALSRRGAAWQRLGGAMGVIGPIGPMGPMGPIGCAAKQRVGARWWRCLGSAWRLEPPCLFALLGLLGLFALPRLL